MASRDINDLHPVLASAFGQASQKWNAKYPTRPKPFLTATYRSSIEQEELYAQGRTKPGTKVTNARAGQSAHNYKPSYAFDVAFRMGNGQLDWASPLFRDFNELIQQHTKTPITWGGTFRSMPDAPHWELAGWKTMVANAKKAQRPVYRLTSPYTKDDFIIAIQCALGNALKVSVQPDGVYGPATEQLVKRFQVMNRLTPDGIIGAGTLKALGLS